MPNQSRRHLFLVSFAALFFEVLVIRWLSSEILVFGYFKNLILMGAFVGLGLGCATTSQLEAGASKLSKQGLTPWFPILFLILVALIASAPHIGLTYINFVVQTDVFFWLGRSDVVTSVQQLLNNALWVVGIFVLIVCLFDSLGQLLGRELSKHEPLHAYAANLSGSAAGVLIYSLLAFLKTPPPVWLFVGFASLLPFYKSGWQRSAMCLTIAIAFVAVGSSSWSPYYRVDIEPYMSDSKKSDTPPYRLGSHVIVNHSIFQRTVNLSQDFLQQHPEAKELPEYMTYNLPYEARPGAENVLILGAGSGNDVSAALRHGVKHVDAVEIDPSVMDLGITEHPEHPYKDPRVCRIVNDARNFVSSNNKKYDLIVFGFVDSSVSFSMLSSVRLDNFLYTVESLQLVTKSLAPNGIGCLSFAAGPPWLRDRLYQMVEKASSQTPIALSSTYANSNSIIILWGPGLTEQKRQELLKQYHGLVIPGEQLSIPVPLCLDDWPFLYQKERALTAAYGIMLSLLILIAGSLTVLRFRLHPKIFLHNAQFFFLGSGFLLLETRAMLAVAVLFGSTWLVNSIVIFLILLMAILANWIVQRFPKLNSRAAYGVLFVSLLVLYLVPLAPLAGANLVVRVLAATALVGLPFACAGLVFSSAYAKTKEPGKALGMNILGALLGGCLEYSSIIIGTRNLVLIALVLYVISFVSAWIIDRKVAGDLNQD